MSNDSGVLIRNQNLHEGLIVALRDGEAGLRGFPSMLLKVIQTQAWQERYVSRLDKVVKFIRFIDYVKEPPLEGLGADIALLQRLCHENLEARQALDDLVIGQQGGDRKSDKIKFVNHELELRQSKQTEFLRRLRADFPEIYCEVLSKQKTVTAGAIAAGIYPRRISINARDQASAAQAILRNCGSEYAAQLEEQLRLLRLKEQGTE